MTKEQLLQYFSERSSLVDQVLLSLYPKRSRRVSHLHDGVEFALGLDEPDIAKRGKRFRPILCLLACEMLGGSIDKALPFAAAVELMHNYCLVHDDIEDGDTVRRGRPAVWSQFGLAHGINIGDFMISSLYNLLLAQKGTCWGASLTLDLINLMTETLNNTLVGQAMDINARASHTTTMDEYMTIVRMKTGFYLASPMLGGALIAHADESIIRAIKKYGDYTGPLFQVMDDIIDLTVGKGRNEIGADIKEGKRSFMVVYVNQYCTRQEARDLFAILDKPREKTTRKNIQWVLHLFETYKVIDAGLALCKDLKRKSQTALKTLPRQLRDALSTFSEVLSERVK